ncbi:TetR/AcrR family transcriptional regulator [Arthrobacter sp. APC 3897]|uniref:TetR/AcrR family transcriptional regulator n=1 Tax=Arthrobacter sp. APC 3897 TaxID=3035204 RepID=UPI0025B2F6FE|nr:TetR/AcrR family transcriptional regulator [Arthrobacter sp. APC 3897]MDN3481262.1 TetR/AcrR family transcriptional regulator [Arthrobacter sp. APC 3897]
MPKIVDHDRRRAEIVQTTWRVIAQRGLDGATLREVAAEAGYANGALKPYFPAKADLMEATFRHVFASTNARIDAATEGLDGLEALRAFCLEVLPLDDNRLDEARVVIAFWQQALRDPAQAEVNDAAMAQWRTNIRAWLNAAHRTERTTAPLSADNAAETLLSFLLGTQVAAVFDPDFNSPDQLTDQLDSHLALLRG